DLTIVLHHRDAAEGTAPSPRVSTVPGPGRILSFGVPAGGGIAGGGPGASLRPPHLIAPVLPGGGRCDDVATRPCSSSPSASPSRSPRPVPPRSPARSPASTHTSSGR